MKPLLDIVTAKTPPARPPIWLMRQAGRYLPEYRAVRDEAGSFLNLCYNPKLAEEVTLQPIRKYNFDGAILFADILLLPQALGQKLWFETGEGPKLTPIKNADNLRLGDIDHKLAPIGETIRRLTKSLPPQTTLIGFAGAPWTVASYMVAGGGTKHQMPAKNLAKKDREAFQSIIDILVLGTIDYLAAQAQAGAQILMLFESWAGALDGADFEDWCIMPVKSIIASLRTRGINCPIIAFPRATNYSLAAYVDEVKCDILGLDSFVNRQQIVKDVPENIVLQGNLNPISLCAGGHEMRQEIDTILKDFAGRRFIFNLGHGVLPNTPPSHVAQLVHHLKKA